VGRVVVLGSINMDLVARVPALPRPGDTVLAERLLTIPGGKGANQAVAAARLGAHVSMVGRVGDDEFGKELITGLEQDDIDASGVAVDKSEPSGVALIIVESGGQNVIAVAAGANSMVGEQELKRLRDGLGPDDVVVVQLEIPLPAVLAAIRTAHEAGARVILNAAPSAALVGQQVPPVDLLIVNEGEAAELGGSQLRESVGALAVTLGAAGSVLYEKDQVTRIEPQTVEAVDATAAGDALVGAAAFSLAGGSSMVDAVRLGGAAGAAAVTKVGARPSLPRPDDLRRLFGIELAAASRVKR
jgi:ribokinase